MPVIKPDESLRIFADYKTTVNKVIEDLRPSLQRIEELFAALAGGERFTKLDLSMACNQLEVTEENSKLLAWSTHRDTFIVKRLPLGTKTTCAICRKIMEKLLLGAKGVICFFLMILWSQEVLQRNILLISMRFLVA